MRAPCHVLSFHQNIDFIGKNFQEPIGLWALAESKLPLRGRFCRVIYVALTKLKQCCASSLEDHACASQDRTALPWGPRRATSDAPLPAAFFFLIRRRPPR